ncbi:DNA repair and recombination protein RadB [Candidatus Pacearchaeota archaeon]|nr:DNA repair and recombination protein RadB [Candidatus Pacearchaeota archaeon]MBD3283142.1 DNA repair and recombination protein RadB [Candidatus Pacearchaeota archaeon]
MEISEKVMTGSYDLNKWLEGGYEPGVITLFYGPPASGKSNFVILASCHSAKKNKKVIFIDTEGSFSVDRVKQISGGIPEFVLKNIVILKPTDFQEQKQAFLKLLKESKSENIGLIVADSMTMLYRLELAEARRNGMEEIRKVNYELANQMKALYEIARKKQIPVLITTQIYYDFLSEQEWLAGKQADVNVIGGDILRYWIKCIIELINKAGKKKAIIRKHRSLPVKELNFEIINEGIRKKSWF